MRAARWSDRLPRFALRPRALSDEGRSPFHEVHAEADPARAFAWRPAALVAATLALSLAAALGAFAVFAEATFDVGPARVAVSAQPALEGGTSVALPPFGSVTAHTHSAPLAVTASLQEVDLQKLQSLAQGGIPGTPTIEAFKAEAYSGARQAVGKGLMASLVVAAFVAWALRRSWRTMLAAGVLGIALPAVLVVASIMTFNGDAFRRDPSYEGAMRYAPSLISFVQGRVKQYGSMQTQLGDAVRELSAYYAKPQTFSAGGAMPHTFRVLQVSDLHLDPIGFQLESELASEFKASLIIDAGDATTFGSPVEGALLQHFLGTGVPRLFIAGNHDNPSVVRTLGGMRNVTVLDRSFVTTQGLTVYGLADPMSRSNGWKPDNAAIATESPAAAAQLRESIAIGRRKPDIIVVHNPVQLEPFKGMAPLYVAGHTHVMDLQQWDTGWYVNSGSIGGVAYNKVYEQPILPHGASIFYYTQSLPRRLVAIDQLQIMGGSNQTSLKRTVVDAKLLEQLTASKDTQAVTDAKR